MSSWVWWVVPVRLCWWAWRDRTDRRCGAGAVAQVAAAVAVALDQTPGAMALMRATELVTLGRIVSRRGPVTHLGERGRREQLKLPHT
ncbi:hypothetical protein ACTMTJ_28630 [Phytohabitans sp. LJ34]|uniref:hypothetical protein n=1 Tax=Phytohabitans sp. LJ34 TaxID=3452217 RepID=UPI003F8B7DBF